jgi:predicted transcriptional regulator
MWRQLPRLSRQSEARRNCRIIYNQGIVAQSIEPRIATADWQIQDIKAAIAEANAGDFATDAEVKAVMDKWNDDSSSVPPK